VLLRPFRLLLLALVAAFVILSCVLFLFPNQNEPKRADAVVVLAGSHLRLGKGLELMRKGVAETLVISDGFQPDWPQANRLCRNGSPDFEVICFHPDPYSTRGEAEEIGRLVRARRWKTVAVVTSTFHVTRARMLVRRCTDAHVDAVGAHYPLKLLPVAVVSEWGKLAYALTLGRKC
jgi:uncharacterized SAM-binding protein YcdF (DUF218 family)